jgi:hypothetical protein
VRETGQELAGFCSEQWDVKHPDMKAPTSKKPKGKAKADGVNSPFDTWLNRGLHKMYDDVAQEPIPDDLLKLIEDDRNNPKT